MTKRIDDGGPAYPFGQTDSATGHLVNGWGSEGMTLRDAFAMRAMAAMVASPEYCAGGWPQNDIAKQSYEMADAMLRARSAGESNGD